MAMNSRRSGTVLTEPGKRNVLVTSALPYVNNIPHLGNIIGTTTEARALAERYTPQELCDKYRVIYADIYKWFNINFDTFGRTTTKLRLLDPFELKNPRYKVDGATPITKKTNHIFIELDKLQPEIEAFFRKSNGTKIPLSNCYDDKRNPKNVQLFQFLGKDNIIFHSIIFPATQIGTQKKFSKSRNIGNSFISNNNNLLLKNFGNFVSRVLKFINSRNYDSIILDWAEYHEDSFSAFKDSIAKLLTRYIQELDAINLRSGMTIILAISQQGNGFLHSNKLDGNLFINKPAKCAAVIGSAVNLAHLIASLLAPYMPDTADSINKQLAADPLPILDHWSADSIKPGHKIGKAEHLFRPIKPEKAQEWRKAFGADEAKKAKEEEAALKVKKTAALKAAKAVAGN
ncbi:methionyl-tRNA synthetase [Xylariaceae sp. FL0255]|nr:methionyl-tRNA synthetase [Xylariaceae sp. FL0255]